MDVIYGRGFLVQISLAIGQEKISQGKVEYKNILWHTDLIPRHSVIAWMAVNNGLYTLDKVSIFRPDISRLLAYSLALIMSPLSIYFLVVNSWNEL